MLSDSLEASLSPLAPPPPPLPGAKPIAPALHTVLVLALFIGTTTYTTRQASHAAAIAEHAPRIFRYLGSIGLEWLFLGIVLIGIYRKREFLLGAYANRARTWVQSLGWGILVYVLAFFSIIFIGLLFLLLHAKLASNEAVLKALAPHSQAEFIVWFFLSLTAGLCEETIFRGYLQQQFTAWTQRPIVAILLTAVLFGSVHLYEGPTAVLSLVALALVYGFAVRYFNGDLRAVVVAHTLQDFIVGLLLLAREYILQHNLGRA